MGSALTVMNGIPIRYLTLATEDTGDTEKQFLKIPVACLQLAKKLAHGRVAGDDGAGYFAGSRRFSSSVQFSTTTRLRSVGVSVASSLTIRNRWPSGDTSYEREE